MAASRGGRCAVSQNSAVWPGRGPNDGVDVDSRRARVWTARMPCDRAGARGGWSHRIPRKEVIQPQLPLRLPCYDFTPITDSTFGRCLPKGWLTDFGCFRLSWCDGRCVQGPGTYSPRRC